VENTPKLFTVEEVNALIPTLTVRIGRQLELQSDIEQGLGELAKLSQEVPISLEPAPIDEPEVERLKRQVKNKIGLYEFGWIEIQELGVVVKDPRIGLLDFYGRVEGRLVWLCWRYGEESLGYYHELEAGYSGRRPLGPETRARLLN
jgi:hypothetical protein